MIITWIFLALGLIVGLIATQLNRSIGNTWSFSTLAGLFFFVAIQFIGWGVSSMVQDEQRNYSTTYELREMQLTSTEEGSFSTFLSIGGGSFGTKGNYYFYAKSPDGAITLGKIAGTDMVFFEGDYKAHMKCKTNKQDMRYDSDDYHIGDCKFYIPTGKINDNIDVTLKGNL